MGRRWTAADGWEVELIRLNGREVLRIRQYRVLIVYALTVEDLARVLAQYGLDPADLVEVDD